MRFKFPTHMGNAYITITEDEGGARECFTAIGKAGSDINALSEAMCRLVSLGLGYNVPIEEIAKQLLNITSQPVIGETGWVKSLPDAIGQALVKYIKQRSKKEKREPGLRNIEAHGKPTGALCPDCGAPIVYEEGCSGGKCNSCGYSKC